MLTGLPAALRERAGPVLTIVAASDAYLQATISAGCPSYRHPPHFDSRLEERMVEGHVCAGVDPAQIVPAPRRQPRFEARGETLVGLDPGHVPTCRPRVADQLEVVVERARDGVLVSGLAPFEDTASRTSAPPGAAAARRPATVGRRCGMRSAPAQFT